MDAISRTCDPILAAACAALQSAASTVCLGGMQLLLALVPYALIRHRHVTTNDNGGQEWGAVMQLLLQAMSVDDEAIRATGYHVLIELAARHYDKLNGFMQSIFKVTLVLFSLIFFFPRSFIFSR
jgi:hypothetical protein